MLMTHTEAAAMQGECCDNVLGASETFSWLSEPARLRHQTGILEDAGRRYSAATQHKAHLTRKTVRAADSVGERIEYGSDTELHYRILGWPRVGQ